MALSRAKTYFSAFGFTAICLLALNSCASLPIEQMPSKNYSQRIKFLVMHFTAIDYHDSVKALVDEGGLSAHYLVPERFDPSYDESSLKVMQLVDEDARAWHAGRSYWQGREDINDQSIGIEVVNVPSCRMHEQEADQPHVENSPQRLCIFPDYDPVQIELLITLSKQILARNPDIGPTQVIGHADIAPGRKNDPGPRFPWYQLYKAGIGAWYETDDVAHYWQLFQDYPPAVGLVQSALRAYGYGVVETGVLDQATIDTLSAFQMHFIPWQVSGRPDSKTVGTLFALLHKYFPDRTERLIARFDEEKLGLQPPVFTHANGQVEQVYPVEERSPWIDDRTTFKSYAGRGEIIIDNRDALSASIEVNGEKLNIADPLQAYKRYEYSLERRVHDGMNTLKVTDVEPPGSQLKITIPYPSLTDNSSQFQTRFRAVDKLIEQDVANGFPGGVLLVVKDGQIVKRSAYGYARKYADGGAPLSAPVEMKTDTIFDLASNTKMFATNLALMKLVSEGKLDVSRPIHDYLPDYHGQGRESRLVRDLLTHTAGYGPEVRFFDPENPHGKRFYSQQRTRTQQLLVSRVPFETGRGLGPVYSDTDYMLLGLLIERITGMPLDHYVEHTIYQPLALQNTRFNPLQKGFAKTQFAATEIRGNTRGGRLWFDNIREYVLQGEVHDEKAYYSSAGVSGHAGLFSTVDDLAVLAQLLINGGGYGQIQLLDKSVIDAFIKPEEGDATYGLGWRRASNGKRKWHFGPYASDRAFGHTGWTGTVTVIDPQYDLAIILLTNMRHAPVIENEQGDWQFATVDSAVSLYGNVVSLVYEAVLNSRTQ